MGYIGDLPAILRIKKGDFSMLQEKSPLVARRGIEPLLPG
jgi:hypothetical protein